MSKYGVALVLLIGALTFLASPQQAEAAMASHGLGAAVADSVLDQGIVDPVHYSRRYGALRHVGALWPRA